MSTLGSSTQVCITPKSVIGQHYAETLGTVVFSPVVPAGGARHLLVQAVTQNIRCTLSAGQVPTAAIGFQLVAGAVPIYIDMGTGVTPQFFREAGGAILQYQWIG